MARNFFIGVGGVGSRIMESLVRLCECGFVSADRIGCVMVDVDQGHGNTNNTVKIINNYNDLQKTLNSKNIFKTALEGAGPQNDPYRITPLDGISTTTVDSIAKGGSREDRNLANILFTDNEQSDDVAAGFYGNLALGNVFYNYALEKGGDNDNSPMSKFLKKIAEEAENQEVKVFIAASLFGGTGASGVSFICHRLLEIIGDSPKRDNVHIQAALMLPYFRYDENVDAVLQKDNEGNQEKQRIFYENFKKNAHAALDKYKMMHNVFDKVLLLGDPQLPIRGTYSHQGSNQKNWPHILELFAAAEAGEFFNLPDGLPTQKFRNTEWHSNPHKVDADSSGRTGYKIEFLKWSDYKGGQNLKNSIENYLLFNYYYSTYVAPMLFDYQNNALVSWNYKAQDANTARRRDQMHEWAKHKFLKFEAGMLGLGGKHVDWLTGLAVTSFTKLFNYLTDSAQWYYTVAFDFGEAKIESRPCWEVPERPACAGSPDCQRVRNPLVPKIFEGKNGGDGLKLIHERACLHKKPLAEYSQYSVKIHERFGRIQPPLNQLPHTRNRRTSSEEEQKAFFAEVVNEVYNRIKNTTPVAN